ncbi:helix-turn-helix transcriptional regulator [Leuconostoc falkenbergense]|uniref:helix-turn-helix domain-containing protein n=1 Tax=Leuconostoc TaxID=1243 RepID=UPI0002737CF9|nr:MULTISPECIES: helix-turn-helix transcriptional regulator [Leuconostoc]KDA48771.1 hypothetical protein L964_1990 [Leuconostoc pseudomesenteroides 1159]KDA50503.1 hypothetical protein L965_1893 [Leuconostoc pseudomesenteroides PS12]OQJ68977.1 transcriptional regulator [Leuconostoc pseudomesenteroides]CCJ66350.1 hypothetical protein Q5C_03015 [Leuconostoc pseudomesenteroides 4882]MDG9745601.1 helix-turn-helix transcriptional regulator [Leuconostoc falkenbergense]
MNRLAELRKKRGVSLGKMTNELTRRGFKITNSTLSNYENEKREPKLETWELLADYFNVTPQYLVGWADE